MPAKICNQLHYRCPRLAANYVSNLLEMSHAIGIRLNIESAGPLAPSHGLSGSSSGSGSGTWLRCPNYFSPAPSGHEQCKIDIPRVLCVTIGTKASSMVLPIVLWPLTTMPHTGSLKFVLIPTIAVPGGPRQPARRVQNRYISNTKHSGVLRLIKRHESNQKGVVGPHLLAIAL